MKGPIGLFGLLINRLYLYERSVFTQFIFHTKLNNRNPRSWPESEDDFFSQFRRARISIWFYISS